MTSSAVSIFLTKKNIYQVPGTWYQVYISLSVSPGLTYGYVQENSATGCCSSLTSVHRFEAFVRRAFSPLPATVRAAKVVAFRAMHQRKAFCSRGSHTGAIQHSCCSSSTSYVHVAEPCMTKKKEPHRQESAIARYHHFKLHKLWKSAFQSFPKRIY